MAFEEVPGGFALAREPVVEVAADGVFGGAVGGADELAVAALAEFLGNGGVVGALAAADADVVGAAAVRGEATDTGTIRCGAGLVEEVG